MNSSSELITMLAVFTMVWLFWDSWIVYPIKILTVIFHEAGHAIAILLTGGEVEMISLSSSGLAGFTLARGGSRFLMLNAGYLGSILFGFLFFYLTYTSRSQDTLLIMGFFIMLLTFIWIKQIHAVITLMVLGLMFVAVGIFLTGLFNLLVARFVALCSMLYSFVELRNYKIMLSSGLLKDCTDAEQLEGMTGVHSIGWTIFWSIIAFFVLLLLGKLMLTGRIIG